MSDIDSLKEEISRAWLGRGGVCAVGTGQRDGAIVVVVSLEGRPEETVQALSRQYSGQPVVVEPDEGPIQFLGGRPAHG